MSVSSTINVVKLQRKTIELMMATPFVMSRRVNLMLRAPAQPVEGDLREFNLMASEKVDAMTEAWVAMQTSFIRFTQGNIAAATQAWMNPRSYRDLSNGVFPRELHTHWNRVAAQGVVTALRTLDPVHRRAVANAKRLRK
jgi:hypothetical protein